LDCATSLFTRGIRKLCDTSAATRRFYFDFKSLEIGFPAYLRWQACQPADEKAGKMPACRVRLEA
jgi:hypothetical protein